MKNVAKTITWREPQKTVGLDTILRHCYGTVPLSLGHEQVKSFPGNMKFGMFPGLPQLTFTRMIEEQKLAMKADPNVDAKLSVYIKSLKERLFFEPLSAALHYNLGLAYGQKGMIDEAISEFKQALECDPGLAQAHVNLGGLFFKKGDMDGCIDANLRAIALDPNLPMAHSNLGLAYLARGSYREAIESSERAVSIMPDLVQAHNTLALAHLQSGRPEASIAASLKILSLNEKSPGAHYNLYAALQMEGREEEAKVHFERARELGYPVEGSISKQ